jgi:excinuclease ABC subunit A
MKEQDKIVIRGARENNLKNLSLEIPRNKLVVMTGLSGSGKTSLAFDTIYAEGQRRYVESLSAYARQFLGGVEKPNVESIEGLSPAISIDQKTTSNNPRSTVGTVTEIYDYLRLLYARTGTPYCPTHNIPITGQTITEMVRTIMKMPDKSRLTIMAPLVSNKKGTFKDVFAKLIKDGYIRVRVDREIRMLEDDIVLEKNQRHDIDVVIDRIVKSEDSRSRIHDSMETALKLSDGKAVVMDGEGKEKLFSSNYACPICGFSVPNLEPRLFSFNAPLGACDVCKGLGFTEEVDVDNLIPDRTKSIREGGIRYYKNIVDTDNIEWQTFSILCKSYKVSLDKPIKSLTKKQIEILLHGSDKPIKYSLTSSSGTTYNRNDYIEGVKDMIERRYAETSSSMIKDWLHSFMIETPCPKCHGDRLNEQALSVRVGEKNIAAFTAMSVTEALDYIDHLKLDEEKTKIADMVLKEIRSRLQFLKDVGLEYLTLDRLAGTLSGGESQRIRLATQIGSRLSGVLYVMDEPSIGLHQRDNAKLIQTMKNMRDLGNSLIVVEHDEETMMSADWIVDIGPGAGVHGGELMAEGTPQDIMNSPKSITGAYLSGKRIIPLPDKRRKGNGKYIEITGVEEHNLKKINVKFPLGKLVLVTGVSGSGKSTLVNDVLMKAVLQSLGRVRIHPGKFKSIKGLENVDKLVQIDQQPIGRTPRSNPATYTGVFDDIRDVFAKTPEARLRGYDKGRFSFNTKGGRCEACQGDGVKVISMNFLPDVYVPCEICHGKRYNEETLQCTYKGKSIYDVLEMSVEEALTFFSAHPKIKNKLQTLYDVGLGYMKLGQSSTTLSGGEAQRIKLASELQKKATGRTVYILDEPTTGLHTDDVKRLIGVLQRIVDGGDTVVVIEHNLDVIKCADWIIDLGPEGGDNGGTIIAQGTPEHVAEVKESWTGQYLIKALKWTREHMNKD